MSDDFDFDDDSFLVDDSFLKEVDNIAAQATSRSAASVTDKSAGYARTTSLPATNPSRGWTGSRTISAGPSLPSFARPAANGSRPFASARSYKPSAGHTGLQHASSSTDEFDDLTLPLDSFDHLDALSARPQSRQLNTSTPALPTVIPSSRLGRTSSGGEGSFQTHLNFRREKQATKGKRWDRTAFAESGRRVTAEKAKARGKGKTKRFFARDDDEEDIEEEEEEDDWGEPLAPYPKPLVDTDKPYEPQRHEINPVTVETYIYPTNRPKRDYQYEIVRGCFTDNCLVALPTGLGKTFIAGVVMLNFYRWFPTGKIVFLAPTKPLVNQQIEACQLACGIPSNDAAVMTGSSVSAKERARLWEERRVFYCTPQTLDNDLKKGSVDPRDIVLAVFDEAHKASGYYAYTTILAYITAHHPYFRVLALTATPGADVPKVQGVVDALHISRIEIREAEAAEIRKYMNEKRTEKHFVAMGERIADFRDRWAALMKPYVQKLVDKEVLTERDLDAKRLKPFRLTAKRMELARDKNSSLRWCFGTLQQIERMARAMGSLLEFSLGMFHTSLSEIAGGKTAEGKKSGTTGSATSLKNNFEFQKLLRDVEAEINCISKGVQGRSLADKHPKMGKTLELLLDHFQLADEDEKIHGVKNDTRAMVFCSYRECVLEVVAMLNQHPALLRATKFVGQSQGKQEADKGFNQKEQKRTIQEFKEGKYNVLVSTSIGEEGLDIGEVDFVVIYDMPKQSIKLLQRVGRTGRKRDGKVHVLMSENREDANWDTAQQTHREIQEEILHSRNLELFEDVEPLLPLGKFPKCVEQEMPVDPWDPADQNQKNKRKLKSASQRERDKEEKAAKKQKQRGHEIPDGAHEGFKSVAELLKGQGKATAKKRGKQPVGIQSDEEEEEEEDEDAAAELLYGKVKGKGASKVKKATSRSSKSSARSTKSATSARSTATEDVQRSAEEAKEAEKEARKRAQERTNQNALDFFRTEGPLRRKTQAIMATPPSSPPVPQSKAPYMPSPSPEGSSPDIPLDGTRRPSKLSPRTAAIAGFSQVAPVDLSWEDDADGVDDEETLGKEMPHLLHTKSTEMMPPPPLPLHVSSPYATDHSPHQPTQFPVRRPGHRGPVVAHSSAARPAVASDASDSPIGQPRRIRRRIDSSPVVPPPGRRSRVHPGRVKKLLDLDVEVSGSESSDEPSGDEETESDRLFANDFQPTQAPKGYNQRAMYAAGLSTQVAPAHGLAFKPRHDQNAFLAKARKPVLVSDEEDDGSENEYELGSFVCDDADVSFDTQTQSDPASCS